MHVLITGGVGFIGSHVAEYYLRNGDEVSVMDNFTDHLGCERKRRNADILLQQGARVFHQDIRDTHIHEHTEPDVIVHLAALAGVRDSASKREEYIDVNVHGTMRVLESAEQLRVPVVIASSSSVYGKRTRGPFKETDRLVPASYYALTKQWTENLARLHQVNTGLPTTSLRFFTVYGPRGREDMAPYKFMQASIEGNIIQQYGDGTSMRDYTYIDDIVQGIVEAANNNDGYHTYNLGNEQPVSLNEFILTLEEVTGKPLLREQVPMPGVDVPLTYADITRAKKDLGYNPSTSLRDGLQALYEWMKSLHEE